MKELKLVPTESDSSSLIFSAVDPADNGAEFYVPVTDELRDLLTPSSDDADQPTETTPTPPSLVSVSDPESAPEPSGEKKTGRPKRTHLNIRPRVIQERIRSGASIAELADEADTDESTIEPYAWPILQERSLVAENAHGAYPFVEAEGGPAQRPLWEVLATAFAARGEALSDAEWDSYQDASRNWVVTISWNKTTAGQTASHVAEFGYDRRQPEPQVVQPLNSLAADLVDPRYGRPVRSISPVTPLVSEPAEPEVDEPVPAEDLPQPRLHPAQQSRSHTDEDTGRHEQEDTDSPRGKRRRKAVTPHWEDVLLGVRTNPKKNR